MLKRHAALLSLALAFGEPAKADDFSANPITIDALTTTYSATLLKTVSFPSSFRWFAMNMSTSRVWVVIDNGALSATDASDATRSVYALEPASAAGAQGASMGSNDVGNAQRVRIYGPSGAQVALTRF